MKTTKKYYDFFSFYCKKALKGKFFINFIEIFLFVCYNRIMKVFYEKSRDDKPYIILAKNRYALSLPHFHGVFEIFVVRKGNYLCSCNGKTFPICDNTVAVFDHYDFHYCFEDKNAGNSFQYVMTIPPKYLTKFNELRKGKQFASNVIQDETLCENIISILDSYVLTEERPYETEAVIDLIFSQLYYKLEFVDEKQRLNDFDLIRKILIYIENNFKENISRQSIAKALGYTESHISRIFHQYIGHSIPHHVNSLRLDYIERAKKNDKKANITSLILESGFKSVQSYYRNKKYHS